MSAVFQDSQPDSTVVFKNNTFRNVIVADADAVNLSFFNLIPVEVDGLVFDNCTRLFRSNGPALLKLRNVVVRNTIDSSDMKFTIRT